MAFIASTRSRISEKRRCGSVPWFSSSSMFQPAPTPNRNRPRERRSIEATSFAVTIGSDGRPHLVPITFALDGERLYSAVDEKPKRSRTLQRIENARERPDVTVLVDHYSDDWDRLWWVRLRGRARVLDGGEEADRA